MTALGSYAPHALHYPKSKSLSKELQDWYNAGHRSLVTIPLSWICHAQSLEEEVCEHPHQLAKEIGFTNIVSSAPTMDSPIFYQFLVDKIIDLYEQIEK